MSARWRTGAALLAFSTAAQAHSPLPGIGHFYNGLLHPLLVPAHLMAMIALGLWVDRHRNDAAPALAGLVLALPVGLLAGLWVDVPRAESAVLALAAALALSVAAGFALPRHVLLCGTVVIAAAIGIDSRPDGVQGAPLWSSLAGTWLGVLIAVAAVMAGAEHARRPWMRIALRVVSSWVAAAALIVLALTVAGPRGKPANAVAAPLASGEASR